MCKNKKFVRKKEWRREKLKNLFLSFSLTLLFFFTYLLFLFNNSDYRIIATFIIFKISKKISSLTNLQKNFHVTVLTLIECLFEGYASLKDDWKIELEIVLKISISPHRCLMNFMNMQICLVNQLLHI